MSTVTFVIEKSEPESKKTQFLQQVITTVETKLTIDGEEFEVAGTDEHKVVNLLARLKLRYQKAA